MRVESPQEKYVGEVFGLDDPELSRAREELRRAQLEFMAISPHEARILQFLIRGFQIRRIVEIGTLFGYSAIAMAKALPADGELITLEKNPTNHAVAQNMLTGTSVQSRITALCGDAVELLGTIENRGPFDMVFIDANKGGYVDYLNWAERHVRPGGLIVGDNTFLFGALWGASRDPDMGPSQIRVMREFNERLADPGRYNSILIPTGEGMTVAQRLTE
ncbi:MAG: O-methyltransferase [Bdellovibrionales bacterium]